MSFDIRSSAPFPGNESRIISHVLASKGRLTACFTVMTDAKDVGPTVKEGDPQRMSFYLVTDDVDATLRRW